VKRWVKAALLSIPVAVVAIGVYIYFNMDEEVFKVFVASVLATVLGFLWHYAKLKAGLLIV